MTGKTTNTILILTLAGIILGAALGYYFPGVMLAIGVIGQLFVSALQLLVIPLIVAGIIAGIASLGEVRKLGRPLVTTLVYFVGTTALAVAIGLVLAVIIQPGQGVNPVRAILPQEAVGLKATSATDILLSFIPANLIKAVTEGQNIGIIVFSLFFGGVLATLGGRGKAVADFFRDVREVILKIVYLVLYAAPVGLCSVVGTIVAKNVDSLGELSGSLLYYSLALSAGLLIHTVVVLPLILKFIGQRSPLSYFGNMAPALSTALATGSSAVAFPVTYTGVVDRNRVDNRAGALALPLGMTMNLNGTAMYVTIAALFIAQVFGLSLSIMQIITIAAVSILVSLGAASFPYAGILMLLFVLRAAGFPQEAYAGIGLVIVMDWLFDRFRAVVNVWGDSVAAAVVGRMFEPRSLHKERPSRIRPQRVAPTEAGKRLPVGTRRSNGERTRPAQRPRRDDRDRTRTPTANAGKDRTQHRKPSQQGPRDRSVRQRPERKREPRRTDARKPATTETTDETLLSTPTETGRIAPGEKLSEETIPSRETMTKEKTSAATYPANSQEISAPVTDKPGGAKGEPGHAFTDDSFVTSHDGATNIEAASVHDVTHPEDKKETTSPLEAETPSPEYGRSKARRGRIVGDSHAPDSEHEPETSKDRKEFSLEGISFGRHKKKRTR